MEIAEVFDVVEEVLAHAHHHDRAAVIDVDAELAPAGSTQLGTTLVEVGGRGELFALVTDGHDNVASLAGIGGNGCFRGWGLKDGAGA